ncbi:hypothetical protein [Embleya sp. NPDC050493]|uniref:hypothetical protein n=1 Tax=Embleya sp. NPDC050493 TaxID=3363989 RepID=UPI0037AE5002
MAVDGGTGDGGTAGSEAGQDGGSASRLGSGDGFAKVCHSVGLAILLLSEYWRSTMEGLRSGTRRPPDDLRSVLDFAASLADDGWHRDAVELYESASFGQERAALWAAVCCALVVRLNRHGSAELQVALSYVSAAYCVLASVTAAYYFASGPIVVAALGIGFGVMHTATRN